jgi:hypothetical protein
MSKNTDAETTIVWLFWSHEQQQKNSSNKK